jgi:hypothetical protein
LAHRCRLEVGASIPLRNEAIQGDCRTESPLWERRPRRDGALDQALNRREGAAPTAQGRLTTTWIAAARHAIATTSSLRGTKQSKATAAPSVPCRSAAPGAMQLWIKRSIAARARLPQLKADAQRHGLPRRCAPRNDAVERCAPRNDAVAGGRRNYAVESAARNHASGACGGSSHAPGWGFSRA